jgi:glycosyltransferase involved in cell wall biosynthesis
MTRPAETIVDNTRRAGAAPVMSILIPFFGDDPCALLTALDLEAGALAGDAELVLLDDGGRDDALAARVAEAVKALALPARFVRLSANVGRAKGRNRLAAHARGGWMLFLDSDMLPDGPAFLRAYIDLIRAEQPAVVFGGFSLDQTPRRGEHALHRRMALRSDCMAAAVRRLAPEKHVFTSNLLIRRDVFETEPFDEAFSGWGWEDVEWAMRVARRHPIVHVDNTATHLGLDPAPVIAAKYEQSAGNFARVVAKHRSVVASYPSYRAARLLSRLPLRAAWRPALKAIALAETAPLAARAFAMRLYRAALYAEAV